MVLAKCNYELYRAVDANTLQDEFFEAFNKDSREVRVKVELYFDGLAGDPYVILQESDELISWDYTGELSQDSTHPIGKAICTMLNVSLLNVDDKFNPINSEGPWFGKIKEYVPIRLYITETSVKDAWYFMGTYFVSDWKLRTSSNTVAITAMNVFKQVLNAPAPNMVITNTESVYTFLHRLFVALGFATTHINIDHTLHDYKMPHAYCMDGIVSNTINEIAKAYMLHIWLSYDDTINVQSLLSRKPSDYSIDDDNQIISIDLGYSISKAYSGVSTTYILGRDTESGIALQLADVVLQPGPNAFTNIKPSVAPIRNFEALSITDSSKCRVSFVACTPWSLNFGVSNDNDDAVTVSLKLQVGTLAEGTTAVYTVTAESTGKILELDNEYITSYEQAKVISDFLLEYLMADNAISTIEVRGNPVLELGTVVQVVDATDDIMFEGIVVQSDISYNAGISSTIKVLKYGGAT